MKTKEEFLLVLVTAPNLKTARMLAQFVLKERVAACANLVPKIESHYWWRGKIETGAEVLMLFKTTTTQLAALEKVIISNHPYDTPEFVAMPITRGNKSYLDWLKGSLSGE